MNGAQAENWAENYLLRHGLRLLARNYRCRWGEIDLIMQDGVVLVFVEVRQRQHADFGGALASIDSRKQQRLLLTAQHYLAGRTYPPPCRFDVVVMEDATGRNAQWLKDAFQA